MQFSWDNNDIMGNRLNYQNARAQLAATPGINQNAVANAALTQSYLRLEQQLSISQTNYNFPVLSNQTGSGQAVRPNEIRLNLQDAFYVTGVNVWLAKAASATDVALNPQTYPNAITFPTGAAALYAFYNGRYQISVNNVQVTPQYPMMSFLQKPQTQLTAATNSPETQFDGLAGVTMTPNVCFVGVYNTQFQIFLNGNIAALDNFTYAIVTFFGFLAQNVALGS